MLERVALQSSMYIDHDPPRREYLEEVFNMQYAIWMKDSIGDSHTEIYD